MPLHYRSEALRQSLQALHRRAPGISGSAIITSDGLVIAAHPPGWDSDIQDPKGAESVAAMASVIASAAERTVARLQQGALERVLIEGEQGVVGVFPCTLDAALAVMVAKDAKLGLAAHAARQAALEIGVILNRTE
jgi:predicted regulator of Ras-like GTPase activity (Roadblock/LC7/MglB family)